jgi:Mg-chelatase subunit ChlD
MNFVGPEQAAQHVVKTVAVIDVSGSMDDPIRGELAGGRKNCSRLDAAREGIANLLAEKKRVRPQDHLGVIGFSGKAYPICPLTSVQDDRAIRRAIDKLVTHGSTDFAVGLALAREWFDAAAGQPKQGLLQLIFSAGNAAPTPGGGASFVGHVVMLSDGHNNSGDPRSIATGLKQSGVVIDCIGVANSPNEVDDLLREIASPGADGTPRYRFIGDAQSLISDFRKLASLQII